MDNLTLKCPKCHELFSISDFENNQLSKAHYEQFVQKLTEDTKQELEKKCEERLSLKLNQELKAKIENLELLKNKEVAEQLSAKMNEFNAEKELLLKKFNDELNQSNTNNQELKAKIENLELLKNKEVAEQLSAKMNEFNAEKELLLKKFNDELNKLKEEVHKLEMENQKNKLTNNKIQGDNLEQEIEEILSNTFLLDSISKITTIGQKADLLQKVKLDGRDEFIANITYEIKSTKEWSDNWEIKFLDDMRKTKARYGIITATAYSVKYGKKIFAISENNPNIYFCSHENVALVAQIIRMFILTEYRIENSNKNKNDLELKLKTLLEWKKIQFPNFSSKIKNSIEGLERVKTALNNQMQPLEKHINIIKDNFITEIEQGLNLLIM